MSKYKLRKNGKSPYINDIIRRTESGTVLVTTYDLIIVSLNNNLAGYTLKRSSLFGT